MCETTGVKQAHEIKRDRPYFVLRENDSVGSSMVVESRHDTFTEAKNAAIEYARCNGWRCLIARVGCVVTRPAFTQTPVKVTYDDHDYYYVPEN